MAKKTAINKAKKTAKKPIKKAVKKVTSAKSVKVSKKPENVSGASKLLPFVAVIGVVVVIAIAVALFSTRSRTINVESVSTIEDMNDALKIKVKKPENVSEVKYGIENNSVARIEYKKTTMSGAEMIFVMKTSSSLEENLTGLDNDWGVPILMTVIAKDGSDIEVMSYVATDDNQVMKGEWYDNDLYYCMTTDCLTSREDFLQEVNRVIINNHVEF